MEVIMQDAGPVRFRRPLRFAALVTLLGVASLTLSQCTQVSDRLTGVGLSHSSYGKCVRSCNRTYHALEAQERKLHHANMKACASDEACKAAERARHNAEIVRLEQGRKACRALCHKQGSGQAG
jgi:hypothetical protein